MNRITKLASVITTVSGVLLLNPGSVEAASSGESGERVESSSGWKIMSVVPPVKWDVAFLAEAAQGPENRSWLPAGTMPAMVHDILLRQGKIEPPWLPGGTEKCFWVGEQDWVYAVQFPLAEQGREAWLRFQGIANRVDMYSNGQRLASHSSRLPRAVDVSGRLRPEKSLVQRLLASDL